MELFAVRWVGAEEGGLAVRLLDQTLLPEHVQVVDCRNTEALAEAIRSLRVRGAPAIGVAAAYGVVLGALVDGDPARAARLLVAQRPTAVNLRWACNRVLAAGPSVGALLAEARQIDEETAAACEAIGRHGAAVLEALNKNRTRVLTHCNTGMLACHGIGTAFGVVRTLFDHGASRISGSTRRAHSFRVPASRHSRPLRWASLTPSSLTPPRPR